MMRRKGLGLGLGKGYKNLIHIDSYIHSLSAKGVKTQVPFTLNAKRFDLGLNYRARDVKPVSYDFSQGYGEDWEVKVDMTEEDYENETYMPMMNYYYPLPEGFQPPDNIKKLLNNTTLIYFMDNEDRDGFYALALTGGGMDLSWEICESFINLGYYPPVHFCGLPRMAGKDYNSAKNKKIINACIESLQSTNDNNSYIIKQLEDMKQTGKE